MRAETNNIGVSAPTELEKYALSRLRDSPLRVNDNNFILEKSENASSKSEPNS